MSDEERQAIKEKYQNENHSVDMFSLFEQSYSRFGNICMCTQSPKVLMSL